MFDSLKSMVSMNEILNSLGPLLFFMGFRAIFERY